MEREKDGRWTGESHNGPKAFANLFPPRRDMNRLVNLVNGPK